MSIRLSIFSANLSDQCESVFILCFFLQYRKINEKNKFENNFYVFKSGLNCFNDYAAAWTATKIVLPIYAARWVPPSHKFTHWLTSWAEAGRWLLAVYTGNVSSGVMCRNV